MINRTRINYDVASFIYSTDIVKNQDELIANSFLIMFANYYADSYVYDTMSEFKRNKSLYKQGIKRDCAKITKWLDDFNHKLYTAMSKKSANEFAGMITELTDAFEKDTNDLFNAVESSLEGKCKAECMLQVSIMLIEWAIRYGESRINDSVKEGNTTILKMKWMTHTKLCSLLYELDQHLGMPPKMDSIKVYNKYCQLQRKWMDTVWLADNLGFAPQPDFVEDTCSSELNEIFTNKQNNN